MTNQQLVDILEPIVDKSSIEEILMALGDIASQKAEHIRGPYQDSELSEKWERASNCLAAWAEIRLPLKAGRAPGITAS